MRKLKTELAPTLWRTCRAMMNPVRLRLLRLVFEHDDGYTVTEFAKALGIEQSTATIYLRQLNARGLIGVRRQRIKVFYNTQPDRSLPEALVVREAMRRLCEEELTEEWIKTTLTVLRAFTHFNRLAMLSRLLGGPATIGELTDATGVCVKSLHHHLRFLNSAGLLSVGGYPMTISLRDEVHPLAESLLKVLKAESHAGRSYRNNAKVEHLDSATRTVLRRIATAEGGAPQSWGKDAKKGSARSQRPVTNRKLRGKNDAC